MKRLQQQVSKLLFVTIALGYASVANAQNIRWTASTEAQQWKESTIKTSKKATTATVIDLSPVEKPVVFERWGTCFNERGWKAMQLLNQNEQQQILDNLFATDGDLQFTMGRFSMNANDYANDWYSSDEVDGDFQLKYFNIDRDKENLIPFIKSAQKINPDLTFWISPWSPPSWMKINHNYAVVSNADYNELDAASNIALFEENTEENPSVFPKKLAQNDYFIQDPRYLSTYANYFSKFIEAYQKEGIPIDLVMFQNEPWSYTAYPGCAWTAEGIIRFNTEYLGPLLQEKHPEVSLYLGTINTNRYDVIDEILSDPKMADYIDGVGFQWEGGQILPALREKYPNYTYVQTESECGWGSFDWNAAEHTFELIHHYLTNGCQQYTFWNAILADDGVSGWGWKQNALIRVNSSDNSFVYTPEYYAVKHYTHFIQPESTVVSYKLGKEDKMPMFISKTKDGDFLLFAGNFNEDAQEVSVKLGNRFLNVMLKGHSIHTFQINQKSAKQLKL